MGIVQRDREGGFDLRQERASGSGGDSGPSVHTGPVGRWHALGVDEVLRRLGTSAEGLSQAEAATRLRQYGRNELPRRRHTHLLRGLLSQFTHLMAVLLWIGAGLAMFIDIPQLAAAIAAVIVVNGAFSFWQEYHAERAMAELALLLPHASTVLRDGSAGPVPVSEIVPGDVLVLSEGDSIPADGRLLSAHGLTTSDSALTGESAPVPRFDAPAPEDPVMAIMGCRSDICHSPGGGR